MTIEDAKDNLTAQLSARGLPGWVDSRHDVLRDELVLTWESGMEMHVSLASPRVGPIDEWIECAILGLPLDRFGTVSVTALGPDGVAWS